MIINGKVNGVELPVEIDDAEIAQIRSDAVDSFIRSLITVKADCIATRSDALTNEEFDELVEFVTERSASVWDFLADEIITGKFANTVETVYEEILENRVKFYRIDGEVIVPFEIVVRARSQDEAEQYVKDMDPEDLEGNGDLKWYDSYIQIGYSDDVTDNGYDDNDPRVYDAT